MTQNHSSHSKIQLISIFEQTVDKFPKNLAIVCDDLNLTYDALDKKANQYAHYLVSQHIKTGDTVGVLLSRSIECYLAMLALYKIGATYVPISEDAPAERINHILEDMNFAAILTTQDQLQKPDIHFKKTKVLQDLAKKITHQPQHRLPHPEPTSNANLMCYVIYTSGSTGKPNGVAVGHDSICHYITVASSAYNMTQHDKVYHGFSLAFDASFEEIWMAFANGATLIVATSKDVRSGLGLIEFLNHHHITVFSTVPTLLASLKGSVESLRLLILGGEICSKKILEPWYRPGLTILNTYGPTEATVVTTFAECLKDNLITIGKPLPGYEVVILNEALQPVVDGEVGELCIAGAGLAQGYVNRPDITAKKFIQNPLQPTTRLYRTGDLAQWNDRGELLFMGRLDDQVKLRGFRLELSEIEAHLMAYPDIQSCAVALVYPNDPKLVAYFTTEPTKKIEIKALKEFLAQRLPAFMLPSLYEPLKKLPLLPSGKINRKQLPLPKSKPQTNQYYPPTSVLEIKIAQIFSKHLNMSKISIQDDFFSDLGGHSLTAASVVSELRKLAEFQHLSMLDIYHHKTIQNLAKAFDQTQSTTKTHSKTTPFQSTSPWRHKLCAIGQAFGILALYALSSWQILAFFLSFSWISNRYSLLSAPSIIMFIALCTLLPIASLAIVIIAKWTLLGRVKPGKYRLWGWFYVRWWLVSRLENLLFPPQYFASTPLINLYYRLMGAKIGAKTYIDTPFLAAHDLITIGEHTSINHNAVIQAYTVENGWLHLGPISIGSDCYVGIQSILNIHTKMNNHSGLDDLSMLPTNTTIAAKQFFKGSPAQLTPCPFNHVILQASDRPKSRTSRTWSISAVLQCLIVFIVEAIYIGSYLPSIFLLIDITEQASIGIALLVSPIAALMQYLILCMSIVTIKRLCPPIKPGRYSSDSFLCLSQWVVAQLMEKQEISAMADSLYCPAFLRLLGAKVGTDVEVGEISDLIPDLITIHDHGSIAATSTVAPSRTYHDVSFFDRTIIGKNSFVGNSSLLPQGTCLDENSILACLSTLPSDMTTTTKNATWLGSPAILLPNRERITGEFPPSYSNPTVKMKVYRLLIEAIRIIIPSACMLINLTLLHALFEPLYNKGAIADIFFYFPFAQAGIMLSMAILFILLKWTLVGQYRPSITHLWDTFIRKRDIIEFTYNYFLENAFMNQILGTPYATAFLRCLGTKIGRYAYIETSTFEEFDLIQVGDEVTFNADCAIQTHLFEDKIYKMAPIHIQSFCNIGRNSIVLYSTHMEPHSKLGSLSLLMKGETLPKNSHWEGCPARAVEE